jgi:hypothetical protein
MALHPQRQHSSNSQYSSIFTIVVHTLMSAKTAFKIGTHLTLVVSTSILFIFDKIHLQNNSTGKVSHTHNMTVT